MRGPHLPYSAKSPARDAPDRVLVPQSVDGASRFHRKPHGQSSFRAAHRSDAEAAGFTPCGHACCWPTPTPTDQTKERDQ